MHEREGDEERTGRKDRKTDRTTDDRRGGGGVVPEYPPPSFQSTSRSPRPVVSHYSRNQPLSLASSPSLSEHQTWENRLVRNQQKPGRLPPQAQRRKRALAGCQFDCSQWEASTMFYTERWTTPLPPF